MIIAVVTSLVILASRIAYAPVLYLTTTFYKEYGYDNLGAYALMCYLIGDAIGSLFVDNLLKHIGSRIAMSLGTFLMLAQISTYLILINYPNTSEFNNDKWTVMGIHWVCSLCGGFGHIIQQMAYIEYLRGCGKYHPKKKLTYFDWMSTAFYNIQWIISFPIAAAAIKRNDGFDYMITLFSTMLFGSFIFLSMLPSPGQETPM